MDAPFLPTPGAEHWAEHFTTALQGQSDRVRAFLDSQKERMRRAESELTAQFEKIAAEIAADRLYSRQNKEELDLRAEELRRQAEHLERLKADIAAREMEWEKLTERSLQQFKSLEEQLLGGRSNWIAVTAIS